MCGIAGFLRQHPSPTPHCLLAEMTDSLFRRGPDGRAFYLEAVGELAAQAHTFLTSHPVPTRCLMGSPGTQQLGLGNRRLAIVDRSSGQQPVVDEAGDVVAVFNGELYNYLELQVFLEQRGHVLRSRSDGEVLVHLYQDYGMAGLLERINGMFAFALWDKPRGTLYLARDRFGEKPLYYTALPSGLHFASELKGLLAVPELTRRLDLGSLARYLLLEAIPAPRSIYQDVSVLEPGHYLAYSAGKLSVHPYFSLPDARAVNVARARFKSGEAWLEALDWRLSRAVKARLMGEVPIGVLLSGGLDSSLVADRMTPLLPRLQSFSMGFTERSFDETGPAAAIARHLGTQHTAHLLRAEALPGILDELQAVLDEPLADGSLVPTFALAREVKRSGVTVVLSGDGGDEAFGGYPTYLVHRLNPLWNQLPAGMLRLMRAGVGALPSSYDNISWDFKVRRLLAGMAARGPERHALWMGGILPEELPRLLSDEVWGQLRGEELFDGLRPVARATEGHGWLEQAQIQDLLRYLPDDLLVKMDRASMAVSLEVRAPLLDPEIVSLGLSLPTALKVSLTQTKLALRKLGRGRLPQAVLERPKKGFGMPTAHWLRKLGRGLVEEWLRPQVGEVPLVKPEVVKGWLDDHFSGRLDQRKRLWPLIMLARWRRGPFGPGG